MNQAASITPDAYDNQLRELELLDPSADPAYDNLTRLAARILSVQTALISICRPSQDEVLIKSCVGQPAPLNRVAKGRLSQSFCQHVHRGNRALGIEDSAVSDLRPAGLDVERWQVASYLGVPIHLPDGTAIGTFCVVDSRPRDWSRDELETLVQLALCMDQQIAHKKSLRKALAAEALAQSEAEARKSFLAHMSHEIRTPLNGIIGSVDLLMRHSTRRPSVPRQQTELLRTVNRSAQNLQRLLNDALDLAKIDAGKLELAPAPFDLRELVDDVTQLFSANAAAKGLDLNHVYVDLPPGELRLGDGFRLSQILSNLLSNAVKFTDLGSVCLCVHGTPQGIQIDLRDSGCGIAAETLEHLFKPFIQADAATACIKGGTGLGMAIVHQMVELMGGRICVESSPGEGTSFDLFLPMPIADPAELEPDPAVYPTRQLLRGKWVLVADDSSANRLVLQRMLEQLGAKVDKAVDGIEAFALASAIRYDVLMLDIQMPGYNGMDVVRKLRALSQKALAPSVADQAISVAVTANAFAEQVEGYRDAGFDNWLAKPLRQSDLLRVLTPLVTGITATATTPGARSAPPQRAAAAALPPTAD